MASVHPDCKSDDEFQNKKNTQSKRTVRGIRGLAKKSSADYSHPDLVSKAPMYSTHVIRCFENMESNKELILAAAENSVYSFCMSNDRYGDINLKNIEAAWTKEAASMQQLAIVQLYKDVEDDIGASCVQTKKGKQCTKESAVDKLLYISDDEDQVKNTTPEKRLSSTDLTQSPSPPSLSQGTSQSPRKRRNYDFSNYRGKGARGVKKALKHLTRAQLHLQEEELRSLFHSPDPDVTVVEVDDGDITVRIQLKSEMHRFVMKRWQQFSLIMKQLSEQEDVPESHIMLVHKDKTLDVSDTPNSIKLHTADIIECHINSRFEEGDSTDLNNSLGIENPASIELCVQSHNRRNKVFIKVDKRKNMEKLVKLYADKVNVDSSKLKFLFDGEEIDITQTPESMDIENGDCIDVIEAR